jgi:hypothetical protein
VNIELKLDPTQAENYATYHGYDPESGISVEDFVTGKILDKISNDLLEQANRNAIAGVVPVADVTTDLKQTALKEQAVALATAKLEAMQVKEAPVEVIGVK